MAVEFKLPKIAEGVESGDVLEILVSVGDTLELEQEVMELETDKATIFVPSDVEGVITAITCDIGDTIAVGQVILSVEPAAASAAPVESAPAVPATPVAEKPVETVQEPVVPVAPVAPVAPVPPVAPVVSKPKTAPVETAPGKKVVVAAGPAIRRFAREVGVDLQTIQGSGEHGRIVREDVLKVVREGSRQGGSSAKSSSGSQSDGYGPIHVEKMPKIRQTIAKKMHESWTTCPRVTNFDDADVTALEEIRQNSKKEYAAGGIKLTSMPFLVKAVAMALKSHPVINASIDLEQGQIIYKDYVNVGIAIDTERGLVVPSLREADKLGIPDVARQLGQMADNVRSGNFSIDDLRGGTFTISNLGAIGGTYSTPIINTPETAILLVGRSRKLPVVVGDEVKIRLMMPLSLSYDHRLIDGGAAARFLNEVIGYLEAPSRLLLAL
ncbi:MAG: 2-oxo acid dehydrogenase subunit E2 [Mariniblastus sp.]|nr:2-oxo acid dehydrogenase subunit E2 [Mariniblastus sp.]MDG2181181.1 2-oxo acid dehydrogenase subunit E2 [Mariniblastus sp.]